MKNSSMDTEKSQEFWERHAKKYDRVTLFLNSRFRAMAAKVANDFAGRSRVLEIAAGTGLVTLPLANQVHQLVASDLSRGMLQVLQGRTEALAERVSLQQSDVFQLPFPSGTFDGAIVANLLHLLPEPERALREIRRVLRPNAILAAPTFQHAASLLAHITSRTLGLAGFEVHTRFRGQMLPDLIERAGYRIDSEEVFSGILPLHYVKAIRWELP